MSGRPREVTAGPGDGDAPSSPGLRPRTRGGRGAGGGLAGAGGRWSLGTRAGGGARRKLGVAGVREGA